MDTDSFSDEKFFAYEFMRVVNEYLAENPNFEEEQRSRFESIVVRNDGLIAGQHPPWMYEDAMHRASGLYDQWYNNLIDGFHLHATQNVERRRRRFLIESWGIHPAILQEHFRAYQTDRGWRMPNQAMYESGFIEYMTRKLGKRHLDERVADNAGGAKRPKFG